MAIGRRKQLDWKKKVSIHIHGKYTWFTVHLRPPAGILLRPTISIIADSKSDIPWPVTAQVKMCLLKEFPSINNSVHADGAQSILLTTRITGVEDSMNFCIAKKPKEIVSSHRQFNLSFNRIAKLSYGGKQ